jgi:hypothetical protein
VLVDLDGQRAKWMARGSALLDERLAATRQELPEPPTSPGSDD